MDEHERRNWEAGILRSYTKQSGVIKQYVVCVPIDHNTNSNDPPLQNGMIMEFTSYDKTYRFPILYEYFLYKTPMEAKFAREMITRELNRDGSSIFRGYVFGEMEKFIIPAEKLSQLLIDEVATNQLNSVNSNVIRSAL